jgi:hypothetical protein
VVLSGYQIEFTAVPPRRPVKRVTRLPHDETKRQALLSEISELLLKQAIYRIPADARGGFWASFFLTKKKSGEWRPILNLKPLNAFVKPQSFRMQTLKQVLQCPIKGCWTTSLDLKDAYLHVPIHTDHQRWLRFQIGDEAYAFRCLPFGLSTAPRVFTRVVTAVGEHLRCRGVNLCQYLDDWLIVSGSEEEARRHTDLVVETVERLGFIINRQKSHLTPTQQPVFLGASLDLVQGRARPSPERVVSMVTCVNGLRASQVAPARVWLQALGLMASMVDIVPLCRLHMRRIQLHVIHHYSAAVHSLGRLIPMNREMEEALQWWTSLDHLTEGTEFPQPAPTCTVTTDASLWGWGGHLEGNQVQGRWSREESRAHVNLLELWAVSNTLRAFSSLVQGRTVRIQSDSATVVAYLNKQGGTHSRTLCHHTILLLEWCSTRNITVTACHIAGENNVLADNLSRDRATGDPSRGRLSPVVAQRLFRRLGHPQMDLFASNLDAQVPRYCSRYRDTGATAVDAFSISWKGFLTYAFPPIPLIHRVVRKIKEEGGDVILVAPFWPSQLWFSPMTELLVDHPITLPELQDLLTLPLEGNAVIEGTKFLRLTAWRLSGDSYRRKGFLRKLPAWQQPGGEHPPVTLTRPASVSTTNGVGSEIAIRFEPLSSW